MGESMFELDLAKVITVCVNTLEDRGYDIAQSADFAGLEAELPEIRKTIISPNFLYRGNDFSDGNAYWLTLRTDGKLAAVIGARIEHLGDQGLGAYLHNSLRRMYAPSAERVVQNQAPIFDQIRGDVVYFGDLFIKEENRGSRSVLMCFVHLHQALSFMKWPSADWIYAFHAAADVLRGKADQYGFGNRWPIAQAWVDPPSFRSSSEYLSTIARGDFQKRMHQLAEEPEAFFDWPEFSPTSSDET